MLYNGNEEEVKVMINIIGKNIKKLREDMGLNQLNIAHFLNVDQSMISKVEKGERSLSADMLEKLACLFGVTVDDMEKEIVKKPSYAVAFRATELTSEDMETIYRINKIAMNISFMTNKLKGEQ